MNAQQKMEKQIRALKAKVKAIQAGTPTISTAKPQGDNALNALKAYLAKPSIVRRFGKSEVLKVEDTEMFTRKDGTTTPLRVAVTTTGVKWNLTAQRFWKA
jgi:hypothetical protein